MATPEVSKSLVIDYFTALIYDSYKTKTNNRISFCLSSDLPLGEKTRSLSLTYHAETQKWVISVILFEKNDREVNPSKKYIPVLLLNEQEENNTLTIIQSCVEKELEDLAMFEGRWLISSVSRILIRCNIPGQIEDSGDRIRMEERIHFYSRIQYIMNRYPYMNVYQDYAELWLRGYRIAMPDQELAQLRILLFLEANMAFWSNMIHSESKVRSRFNDVLDLIIPH
jgi:hypothetical protein